MYLFSLLLASVLLRPTFCSCSVEVDSVYANPQIEYRQAGGKWIKDKAIDGNILGLEEDTAYEVIVRSRGKIVGKGTFRTWKTDVPVARTVELDPATLETPYLINGKGTADGWIQYKIKGGEFFNPKAEATFIVDGAEYVLLDDMTLRGAKESRTVVEIRNSRAVRVRNCDFADWGRTGYPQYNHFSKRGYSTGCGHIYDKDGKNINRDAAVNIYRGASEVVVERCYFHDATPHTNSWYYSHPAGSQCIFMYSPDHSTVIRYNDFIGSDTRRFNDCVEGDANFFPDGGFNRDADIYGNFFILSNDDSIELDGGQRNVRCFSNRCEANLCGVSIQGCMVSPTFVYDNLFSGMCDEFGLTGQTVKTSYKNGPGARGYVFGNIFWGAGSGINMRRDLSLDIHDNVFCGRQRVGHMDEASLSREYDNRFGVEIEEKDLDVNYPRRDLPFTLSRARVDVGLDHKPLFIAINGTLPEGCVVRQPSTTDWFRAELVEGGVKVTFLEEKMQKRHNYRGAFIVRTPEGLSRGVSLYASTEFVPPFESARKYDKAEYARVNITGEQTDTVRFHVGYPGRFWFYVYGRNAKGNDFKKDAHIWTSFDGGKMVETCLSFYGYNSWAMYKPDRGTFWTGVQHFDLDKGEHTIVLKGTRGVIIEGAVMTDSPKSFEPNRDCD